MMRALSGYIGTGLDLVAAMTPALILTSLITYSVWWTL